MTDPAHRFCWLRLRRHTWERTGRFDRVHDGQSSRFYVVEWVTCKECGYQTTKTVKAVKYK